MHHLRERLVGRRDQHEEFEIGPQILGVQAPERARFVDRMHERPRERKELDFAAFERRAAGTAAPPPPAANDVHITLRADIDQLVVAQVGDPEHQPAAALERRDDHGPAEEDGRTWPREAREEESGDQRLAHQRDERLSDHHDVRRHSHRADLAIADRRECLDAEEERTPRGAAHLLRLRAHECRRSAQQERPANTTLTAM